MRSIAWKLQQFCRLSYVINRQATSAITGPRLSRKISFITTTVSLTSFRTSRADDRAQPRFCGECLASRSFARRVKEQVVTVWCGDRDVLLHRNSADDSADF